MCCAPLVDAAQDMLNQYNVEVDATTLTDSQLAQLHFLETSDESQAEIENRIEAIVNADDAEPYVVEAQVLDFSGARRGVGGGE